MKLVSFTEFRRRASRFIDEVENGESLVLLRRGKPIAEIIPFSDNLERVPSWKQPGIRLQMSGADLSSAILEEREAQE